MSKNHTEIPGIRLKFRTVKDEDGVAWSIATLWIDGQPRQEIAKVRLGHTDPGADLFHAWADAVMALHFAEMSAVVGIELRGRRKSPDYAGEEQPGS